VQDESVTFFQIMLLEKALGETGGGGEGWVLRKGQGTGRPSFGREIRGISQSAISSRIQLRGKGGKTLFRGAKGETGK